MDNCKYCSEYKNIKEKYDNILKNNNELKLYIEKIEKELSELKSLNYDSLDEYFK